MTEKAMHLKQPEMHCPQTEVTYKSEKGYGKRKLKFRTVVYDKFMWTNSPRSYYEIGFVKILKSLYKYRKELENGTEKEV
ncbi:MAG: hypothetical protein Q4A29_07745 [Eubacteriales bacterium]|nr:hypothetical protein [Eubacteriales bacterium]